MWEQRLTNDQNLPPPNETFVVNDNKKHSLKAETSYNVGLDFMEEERRMARKYHEEGIREESLKYSLVVFFSLKIRQ